MSLFTVGWIIWIAFFVVEEAAALIVTKNGSGTLSDHIAAWFDVKGKSAWARLRHAVLLLGLVWITVHLTTGWL